MVEENHIDQLMRYVGVAGRKVRQLVEISEELPDISNYEGLEIEKVVLTELQQGVFVRAFCNHPHADYIIQKNEGYLCLWAAYFSQGFKGPCNSLVSHFEDKIEEGILRVGGTVMWPYFGKRHNAVKSKLKETWMDQVEHLFLYMP